jgi:transposase
VCIDAKHAAAALQAGFRNKNDRNDARGIAELIRVNTFREVWIKSQESQRRGMLLTARGTLHSQRVALENTIRGLLRLEGIQVPTRARHFAEDVLERINGSGILQAIIQPLLQARPTIVRQILVLDRQIITAAQEDPVCRLLMTIPGVGPVVALTYRASVDQPHRFAHSRAVGVHAGLTPKRHQSGETDYDGGVSKCGDTMLRAMLYEAAQSMLTHIKKWPWLKAWGVRVAQRRVRRTLQWRKCGRIG